jgi:capsular exopolysaccharide synthesis family protein
MVESTYADSAVTLREHLSALWRRRRVILSIVAAAIVAGVVATKLTRPVYEASGRLIVRTASAQERWVGGDNPLVDLLTTARPEPLGVQLETLQSRGFLRQAIAAAGLRSGAGARAHFRADPETNLITVRVEGAEPGTAARFANAILDQYVAWTRSLLVQELVRSRSFAERAAADAREALLRADDRLTRFRRASGVESAREAQQRLSQDLSFLEGERRRVQGEIVRAQARLRATQARLSTQSPDLVIPSTQPNPQYVVLQTRLADLNLERDLLLQSYRPGSARIRALDAQIAGLERRLAVEKQEAEVTRHQPNDRRAQLQSLVDSYHSDLLGLTAQRAKLDADLREVRGRLQSLQPESAQIRAAQLQRDRDMAEKSYLLIASKLEDLKIREASRLPPARIFERALVPSSPVRPRPVVNLVLAVVSGILLGVCAAMLLDYLDDRVGSPAETERLLGLPVLGHVPAIAGERRLIDTLPPHSAIAESYRSLRSSLSFQEREGPFRSLAVTSPHAGEGRTVTAINLAIAMALGGRSVVLVDADLRWPSVDRLLGLHASPGLTDVLLGRCSLEEALQPLPHHQILVLTGGTPATYPAELLNTPAMQTVIRQICASADVAIFDSPPCVPFTDAQVLGSRMDGILLVAASGETRREDLRRAQELLEHAHGRLLGVVLNRTSEDSRALVPRNGHHRRYAGNGASEREPGVPGADANAELGVVLRGGPSRGER